MKLKTPVAIVERVGDPVCVIALPRAVGRKDDPSYLEFLQLLNGTSGTGVVSTQLCLATYCIEIEPWIGNTEFLCGWGSVSICSGCDTMRQESWKSLQSVGHHRIKLPLLIQRFVAASISRCKE